MFCILNLTFVKLWTVFKARYIWGNGSVEPYHEKISMFFYIFLVTFFSTQPTNGQSWKVFSFLNIIIIFVFNAQFKSSLWCRLHNSLQHRKWSLTSASVFILSLLTLFMVINYQFNKSTSVLCVTKIVNIQLSSLFTQNSSCFF